MKFTILIFSSFIAVWLSVSFCGSCTYSTTQSGTAPFVEPTTTTNPTPRADPTPPLDPSLVVEGRSIGQISLGDSFDEVVKLIPIRRSYDEVHEGGVIKTSDGIIITCAKVLYKNSIGPEDDFALSVYFKDDRVVQIEGSSPKYFLRDKVRDESKFSYVSKNFPEAKVFILKGSGEKFIGGKEWVYIVDEAKGLAFEFRYSRQKKTRTLSKFIVFPANQPFQPGTCVTPPQELELTSANSID